MEQPHKNFTIDVRTGNCHFENYDVTWYNIVVHYIYIYIMFISISIIDNIHLYIHMYMHIHICIYIYIYVYIYIHTYLHMYTLTRVYIYICHWMITIYRDDWNIYTHHWIIFTTMIMIIVITIILVIMIVILIIVMMILIVYNRITQHNFRSFPPQIWSLLSAPCKAHDPRCGALRHHPGDQIHALRKLRLCHPGRRRGNNR